MQVEVPQNMTSPPDAQNRIEVFSSAFEFGLPAYLNLEWVLDAVERNEWGGIWW